MSIFQILAVIFAGWMIYTTRIHTSKLHISSFESGMWYAIWAVFGYIALFPQTLMGISQTLQFARIFDLLVVGALMILTIMGFLNYFIQRELKKKIEDLVRARTIESKVDQDHDK